MICVLFIYLFCFIVVVVIIVVADVVVVDPVEVAVLKISAKLLIKRNSNF